MSSIIAWAAARKSYLSPLLFLSSAVVLLLSWHCNPVPASAIFNTAYHADYVGPLEARLARRGISGGVMGVGYGMGSGSSYARFSKLLNLSEEDIEKIRVAGTPYQIGVHDRAIVTISGARGSVITYEEYVARATQLRNLLLAAGFGVLVLAIGILVVRGTD